MRPTMPVVAKCCVDGVNYLDGHFFSGAILRVHCALDDNIMAVQRSVCHSQN